MPAISIIIPVHNSEYYLPQCIESILKQTFNDFEVLLMENASTDNTYAVAQTYAAMDNRLKLFKLTGKGICYARNEGIERATGKYIVFMDNDDIITDEHLEELHSCVTKHKCEMGIAPFAGLYPHDKIKQHHYPFQAGIYTNAEKPMLFGERVVWARIYAADIIKKFNVRFDQNIASVEDWPFYIEMLLLSDAVAVTDKSCYLYRQGRAGQASIGSTYAKVQKQFSAVAIVKLLLQKYNKYNEFKSVYEYELAREVIGKSFAASPLRKLSRNEIRSIITPIRHELLNINISAGFGEQWVSKWFSYFQYWLAKDKYTLFFKLTRVYRNFILNPLKIKVQ